MVSRRAFLSGSAALGASTVLPGLGAEALAAPAKGRLEDWSAPFKAARAQHPWLMAWDNVTREDYQATVAFEGTVPPDLEGVLYRNGPAGHEVQGMRYHHWFDGDGLVQSWTIAEGQLKHQARLLNTPKRQAEIKAGKPLYGGFGTAVEGPSGTPDQQNVGNINIIDHGGQLLALWEAGSAIRLNRLSLEMEDFLTLAPQTKGLPYSAHPRLDRDGSLWNIGVAPWAGALVAYRISPAGQLKQVELIKVPQLGMVHDFMITERHLVIPLPPLVMEPKDGVSYLDSHHWRPDLGTRVLLIDKDDFSRQSWRLLPSAWIFHYGNAWEDTDGTIHFDAAWYDDPSLMYQGLRDVMRGAWTGGHLARPMLVSLPAKGAVKVQQIFDGSAEFGRFDAPFAGRRHPRSLYMTRDKAAEHPLFNALCLTDLVGQEQRYVYAPHMMAEEHLLVGDYVLGTAIDTQKAQHQVSLFRAEALAEGPLAVARLPYHLPHGLHGNFYQA